MTAIKHLEWTQEILSWLPAPGPYRTQKPSRAATSRTQRRTNRPGRGTAMRGAGSAQGRAGVRLRPGARIRTGLRPACTGTSESLYGHSKKSGPGTPAVVPEAAGTKPPRGRRRDVTDPGPPKHLRREARSVLGGAQPGIRAGRSGQKRWTKHIDGGSRDDVGKGRAHDRRPQRGASRLRASTENRTDGKSGLEPRAAIKNKRRAPVSLERGQRRT